MCGRSAGGIIRFFRTAYGAVQEKVFRFRNTHAVFLCVCSGTVLFSDCVQLCFLFARNDPRGDNADDETDEEIPHSRERFFWKIIRVKRIARPGTVQKIVAGVGVDGECSQIVAA